MTQAQRPTSGISGSSQASITIAELEANYSLYCKALRLLVREGNSLVKIQRTVCWSRLQSLYQCYPSRYKSPDHLYFAIRRDVLANQAGSATQPR